MFRTEIPLIPDPRQLARTARVLTMGSCFADSIGGRLAAHKVPTLVNPFGTVFNPLAAALLLRAAAGEPADWTQHLVEARGRWQSYDLHGSVGAESAEALLARIQELVRQTAEFVRTADVLALTLGTAWVYRLRETGELVSNCHKMPAALFEKELLTTEDIVGQLAEVHALLRRLNPKLRLVLTVSPVRHLRDTLPLNSVSKSVLRLASHYLSELLPDVDYFPAYELLTDDLRDYRFYAADMLHPSAAAEDYIWERFARTYFDAEFGRFRKEWDSIQSALAHRPLYAGAPEHRQFLESTLEKLRRLAGQQVDVRAEIRDVERRLLALPPPPRPKPVALPEPEDDGEDRIDVGQSEEIELASEAVQLAETAERGAAAESRPDAEPPRDDQARRGRGRPNRRGQGKGQREANQVAAEAQAAPNQVLPAVASVAAPRPAKPSYTDYLISSAPELVTSAPEREAAEPVATESNAVSGVVSASELPLEASSEPVKKKKRRSRGGAKRTARKNAARLAADQTGAAPAAGADGSTPAERDEPATEAPVEASHPAPAPADLPAATALPPANSPASTAEPAEAAAPQPDATAAEAVPATAPRKRGAGAGAKKSKVITKSVPVKRTTQRRAAPARKGLEAEPPAPGSAEPTPPPVATVTPDAPAAAAPDLPAEPAAPTPAAKAPRPATAKRSPAPKPAKSKATPAKPAGKAASNAASRARKPTPPTAAAGPGAVAESPTAPTPSAAEPNSSSVDAEAPNRRRGRPPGTKKAPPNEPTAS